MTVQIKGDRLVRSDHQTGCTDVKVIDQCDGLPLSRQSDGVCKRLILRVADLGYILAHLDAVGAVRILRRDEAVGAVAV